jgi:hypothetical protein
LIVVVEVENEALTVTKEPKIPHVKREKAD